MLSWYEFFRHIDTVEMCTTLERIRKIAKIFIIPHTHTHTHQRASHTTVSIKSSFEWNFMVSGVWCVVRMNWIQQWPWHCRTWLTKSTATYFVSGLVVFFNSLFTVCASMCVFVYLYVCMRNKCEFGGSIGKCYLTKHTQIKSQSFYTLRRL